MYIVELYIELEAVKKYIFKKIILVIGMMLPGYVPKRGEYNETYIKVIQGIVAAAAKHGIYTLLDMHQDVFSPKFCVEGMPDWIVNTGKFLLFIFFLFVHFNCEI